MQERRGEKILFLSIVWVFMSGSSIKDCGAVIYSMTREYDALGVFLFLLCSHRMFSGMSQVC